MEIENLYDKFTDKLKGPEADDYWWRFIVAESKVQQERPDLEMPASTALALQLMEWK